MCPSKEIILVIDVDDGLGVLYKDNKRTVSYCR